MLTTTSKRGLIKAVEDTGNHYRILRLSFDGKEVLLPFHKEFVKKIDQEKKIMIVELLDSRDEV